MHDLKMTFIQAAIFWEDSEKNLDAFDAKISGIDEETHLIVLPEMFNTGFSINPEKIAENPEGHAFEWMREKAKQTGAAITGSIATRENGKYFNRLYWVLPNGTFQQYDKRHLFRLGKEWQLFSPGNQKVIINYRGWKISPLICYDLRFPVWSKNRLINGEYEYDLMLYVANWPAVRKYVWKYLLIARALENLAYVAGINRVGQDGKGINHSGDSMVIDAKGQIIAQANAYTEETITVQLSGAELQSFRDQFRFSLDWDHFEL
jgi:omega-amidase